MTRRAIVSTEELRKMARLVAETGVTFRGRMDALGGFSFSILPTSAAAVKFNDGDDLDDRLAEFGAR